MLYVNLFQQNWGKCLKSLFTKIDIKLNKCKEAPDIWDMLVLWFSTAPGIVLHRPRTCPRMRGRALVTQSSLLLPRSAMPFNSCICSSHTSTSISTSIFVFVQHPAQISPSLQSHSGTQKNESLFSLFFHYSNQDTVLQ